MDTFAPVMVGVGAAALIYKLFSRSTKSDPAFSWKPQLGQFGLKEILVVTTKEQCDDACNQLLQHCDAGFGFDCEWVSYYQRNPVSLIQMATYDGFCVLFRVCKLGSIPDSLKTLLRALYAPKFGVGILRDGEYLREDYDVNVKNALDLRHLVQHLKHKNGSLALLADQYLGFTMSKYKSVIVSNWEAEELTRSQILYAAMDAYVAIRIYKMLVDMYDSQLPCELPFDKPFLTQQRNY